MKIRHIILALTACSALTVSAQKITLGSYTMKDGGEYYGEMVAGKPTFAQLWQEIGDLMESGILAAHNAPFDMAVLSVLWDATGRPAPCAGKRT